MNSPNEEIVACGIEEGARRTGLGRSSLWRAVRKGELKSYRLGRRRLVRIIDLNEWIIRHEARAVDEAENKSPANETKQIAPGLR